MNTVKLYEIHASNLIIGFVTGPHPSAEETERMLEGFPKRARRDVKIVSIQGWINQRGGFIGQAHTREIVLNMGKV